MIRFFFYGPTQRHRDHREKQSLRVLCGFVRDFFMVPHRGTEITEKNRASVFFAALCGIFLWSHTEARRSQRKTEPPCSLRLCAGFFYGPTQRHGDHRKTEIGVLCGFVRDFFMVPHRGTEITEKNRASVFFAALCGISDCGHPLNPL